MAIIRAGTVTDDMDELVHHLQMRALGRGTNLAAIDWQGLYRDHSGYLMFEDLKQQWGAFEPKFHYVLIDSRTGHTDVGGICTRQLPHAVVLMFFPNEQNISELEMVVEEIRREEVNLNKATKLLFCPSNVPNLDDEYEILKKQCVTERK